MFHLIIQLYRPNLIWISMSFIHVCQVRLCYVLPFNFPPYVINTICVKHVKDQGKRNLKTTDDEKKPCLYGISYGTVFQWNQPVVLNTNKQGSFEIPPTKSNESSCGLSVTSLPWYHIKLYRLTQDQSHTTGGQKVSNGSHSLGYLHIGPTVHTIWQIA